jgi:peroxiredoxin
LVDDSQLPLGWRRIQDGYYTQTRPATLRKDFGLGQRFRVEVRLAWTGKPSFDIAMGIDPGEPSASTAVHLEVWDGNLVLAKQEDGKADAAVISSLGIDEPTIELVILHDSMTGVTIAQNRRGVELARISVPSSRSPRCSGIQIINHGDSLRVESLRTSPWYPEDKPTIVRNESTVKPKSANDSVSSATSYPSILLETKDGSRLNGNFASFNISNTSISFTADSIVEPISISTNSIQRISHIPSLYQSGKAPNGKYRMATDFVSLDINIEPFQRVSELEVLAVDSACFQRPAVVSSAARGTIRSNEHQTKISEMKYKSNAKSRPSPASESTSAQSIDYRIPAAIVLRTGETLHGTVNEIDDLGMRFSSEFTDGSLLKLDELRSLFLHPRLHPVPIDFSKMERLMTIPRNQSDNSPQNILITTSGDYLRGRVDRLSDTTLEFSVKDESLKIPRRNVSAIVWPSEAAVGTNNSNPPISSGGAESDSTIDAGHDVTNNQVEVTIVVDNLSDTGLLRMNIDLVADDHLSGLNPMLGKVKIPVKRVSAISFGLDGAKNQDQVVLPWEFKAAKTPTTWEQGDEGSDALANSGVSSRLIGLHAPPFRLDDLAGDPIRVDQFRGKVVVLDFWASWCAPCIESLPEVYRLVRSFGDDRCQWLGINLQESHEQAAEIANRLKIENKILLDSEGKVASLYEATAIPLIVVIGKNGIVHRVFYGMEPQSIESLRSAIEACLNE